MVFSSCSKENTPEQTKDESLQTEGTLEGNSWTIESASLPSAQMRNDYESLKLTVHDDLSYDWLWKRKDGTAYDMRGTLYYEESKYDHSSGSAIYNIAMTITHINGQALPGGFVGIFTFENEKNLILNVEPDVTNWSYHPTASEGVGSGQNGMESVYPYTNKN